jgi:hypothetical protein
VVFDVASAIADLGGELRVVNRLWDLHDAIAASTLEFSMIRMRHAMRDRGRLRSRSQRPFYGEFAWAYDLLIERPVAKECPAVAGWLSEQGVSTGCTVLDAGCGTGRYAFQLARLQYTSLRRACRRDERAIRMSSLRPLTIRATAAFRPERRPSALDGPGSSFEDCEMYSQLTLWRRRAVSTAVMMLGDTRKNASASM